MGILKSFSNFLQPSSRRSILVRLTDLPDPNVSQRAVLKFLRCAQSGSPLNPGDKDLLHAWRLTAAEFRGVISQATENMEIKVNTADLWKEYLASISKDLCSRQRSTGSISIRRYDLDAAFIETSKVPRQFDEIFGQVEEWFHDAFPIRSASREAILDMNVVRGVSILAMDVSLKLLAEDDNLPPLLHAALGDLARIKSKLYSAQELTAAFKWIAGIHCDEPDLKKRSILATQFRATIDALLQRGDRIVI